MQKSKNINIASFCKLLYNYVNALCGKLKKKGNIKTMQPKTKRSHIVVFLTMITLVFGIPFIIFKDMFNSSLYISEEELPDPLLEPINVEIDGIPEEIAYEDVLCELEETYDSLNDCVEEIKPIINELNSYFQESENALVCSDANKAFNAFAGYYEQYRELLKDIKTYTLTYEDRYEYLQSSIILSPEIVNKEGNEIIEDEEDLSEMYRVAKEKADELFEEDYSLACRLANAEAGGNANTDPREYYAVLGTAENRQKDPDRPDTLYDVIYQPGQYACVEDGNINKEPTETVKMHVKNYMRGLVDFDMPYDVVYQAKSPQGSRPNDPWWISPLGHYFCYK